MMHVFIYVMIYDDDSNVLLSSILESAVFEKWPKMLRKIMMMPYISKQIGLAIPKPESVFLIQLFA